MLEHGLVVDPHVAVELDEDAVALPLPVGDVLDIEHRVEVELEGGHAGGDVFQHALGALHRDEVLVDHDQVPLLIGGELGDQLLLRVGVIRQVGLDVRVDAIGARHPRLDDLAPVGRR
ncbi:MAG: hypothetical protein M3442_16075, partial [Chloroflexota bacterium]|nr:hypothetical protein [Chloroflexota bacterium]